MLKVYKSSLQGCLQELTLDTLEKGSWINIISPTPYELNIVSRLTQVETSVLQSALDDEERSHIDIETDYVMVLINVPIERGNWYDTLPLAIIMTADYLITVCLEETAVVKSFIKKANNFVYTFKRNRFLLQLLYNTATYYLYYLRRIDRASDEMESRMRLSLQNKDILGLLELQKSLTYFNASLRSNAAVLDKLLRIRNNRNVQNIIKVYEEDEDLLEDVIIENKQAREMSDMYSNILARMVDTFSSILSNNLNLVMRFLTSVTIILAIPTVISSFIGMNVHVPYENNPYGFLYIVIISVIVTVLFINFGREAQKIVNI